MNITQWILPVVFMTAGLVSGVIGEKVIFKKLKKAVARRQIPGSEIILNSLYRMTFIWFVLAGFFGA
jgi:hypothetical protein